VQYGHAHCPEHGKLGNLNKSDVERILKKMILENVLREKLETSPHHTIICYLHPGPKAQDLMTGRVKVFLDMEVRVQAQSNTNSGPTDAVSVVVKACFDQLMECRKTIAQEKNLAVHNILTTETLHEMSEVRPHTVAGLKEITGFGQLKVDFYGAKFLEVLQKFPAGKKKADDSWIDTAITPKPKPKKTSKNTGYYKGKAIKAKPAGKFDQYQYGAGASSSGASNTASKPANTSNVGMMPIPGVKKPKLNSIHRRL